MREPVPVRGAALDEHRRAHGRVHEVQQRVLVDVGQRGEQADVELAADHRGQDTGRGALRRRGVPRAGRRRRGRSTAGRVVEIPGDGPAAVVAEHDPARFAEMAQQLAGEERIPVGLAAQRVREPDPGVVEIMTGRSRQQLDDLDVVQAASAMRVTFASRCRSASSLLSASPRARSVSR